MCAILQYTLCIVLYSCGIIIINFVARALLGKRRLCKHSGAVSLHKSTLQQGQICEVVCTNKQGGDNRAKREARWTVLCHTC